MTSPLECSEVIATLDNGEDVDESTSASLVLHLDDCARCSRELDEATAALSALVPELDAPAVSELEWARIYRGVTEAVKPEEPTQETMPAPPGPGGWVLSLLLAAAMVFVSANLGSFQVKIDPASPTEQPEPSVADYEPDAVVEELETGEDVMATTVVPSRDGGITFIWIDRQQ